MFDNSSIHDTLWLNDSSVILRFYEIDCQKLKKDNPEQLLTKNNEGHLIFGYNYMPKIKLFRYNIFINNLISIVTRNDNKAFVTLCEFLKETINMIHDQYEDENFMHNFYRQIK